MGVLKEGTRCTSRRESLEDAARRARVTLALTRCSPTPKKRRNYDTTGDEQGRVATPEWLPGGGFAAS